MRSIAQGSRCHQSCLLAGFDRNSRPLHKRNKKMSGALILLLTFFLLSSANSTSTFDQRQTGDLNVQVDLKDLRIIALMKSGKEDYVDYDYAYDYSEMTIKPQNGTTPRPLNVTSTGVAADIDTDNVTVTTVITEQTTLDVKNNSQDFNQATSTESYQPSTTTKNVESVADTTEIELSIKNITSSTTTIPIQNSTICKKGFIINQKGDCELKLQSAGNALLKLVKLSQKLKLRRENRRNQEESSVTKL